MPPDLRILQRVFAGHSRAWGSYRFVYPVISRRARGLSIGVNLNPDTRCNFDCVYCQVHRPPADPDATVDLPQLERELADALQTSDNILQSEPFRDVPAEYRRVRDIAFSGDGESTASPLFSQAVRCVVDVRDRVLGPNLPIVVITNATMLRQPAIAAALEWLDEHGGQIWAKLDAGTEAYFQQVARARAFRLDEIVENIAAAARVRPVVIQSLFMRFRGQPPPDPEIAAWLGRLRRILSAGGRIRLVQVYTVARPPAEEIAAPLEASELERIAERVRAMRIPCEAYG